MSKTKRLHPRTIELRNLMAQHGLTARQVSAMVGRSRQSIKRYTAQLTVVSETVLDLLKYRLRDQSKPPQ